ncbi:MAG: radical SAM protein [Ignavibacteriae bacterium]|nr:radical SAM protein [Ignavibacteriota bacterium]
MNYKAYLNTLGNRCWTLPIVILYVTEGCNLKCQMCSYRKPLPNELSLDEIRKLADELFGFGLRHIAFSGGEPLLRKDFPEICQLFSREKVKQTLLTNGLLLSKRYIEIQSYFHEIIVSLDGATSEVQTSIRGVDSFETILQGVEKVVSASKRPLISFRIVIQKSNFRQMPMMIELARSLKIDRISFLAVDVRSVAYGRLETGQTVSESSVNLNHEECIEFAEIVKQLSVDYRNEFQNGFISESSEKLNHIAQYFRALLGEADFPRNHCNAPNVSAVITSTGDILPCYFLPKFGNIREEIIRSIVNSESICQTRKKVKEYSLKQCQQCVCTLQVPAMNAFMDRF